METLSALAEELRPCAYVGTGEFDPTPIWVAVKYGDTACDYGTLHRHRPHKSRFVVARDRHNDFLVFDMFRVQLNDDFTTFTFPDGSVEVYPTIEAALMAAQLRLS